MKTLRLDNLHRYAPVLSKNQVLFYSEVCTLALLFNSHKTGVRLHIERDVEDSIEVIWNNQAHSPGIVAPHDLAEYGSLAIAFYLVYQYSDYQVVEQSVLGTGFDYWLGYKHQVFDQNPNNFLHARLEVSGILVGNERRVRDRVRKKIKQTSVSDQLKIPAIIIVVEFSNPMAVISFR